MELHQLRYLRDVVDHGSFTAAASAAHVSQSGVSAQVAKLERELGQTLLERLPRSVRLTQAGEQLMPLVRRALDAVDQIPAAADELAGLVRGRVRVAMATGCTMPPFLEGIAAFSTGHPGVAISLAEGASDDLLDGVAEGRFDVALTGFLDDPGPRLEALVLADEPVVAVLPVEHRLARIRTAHLTVPQLAEENLLCLPVGTGVRAAWQRTADREGVPAGVAVEASSSEALELLVRRGIGVAILARSMVTDPDLAVRAIGRAASSRFGLVTRAGGRTPATEALLARLRESFGR